jgi:peroxin-13
MASGTPGSQTARPKPWEGQSQVDGSTAGGSGAKPWEVSRMTSSTSLETVVPDSSSGPLQQPGTRPWENSQGNGGSAYGYSRPYGSGMYGSGMYGSGMYGSGMYGSGMYGSGMYGSGMYGSGMYGSGMYGSGMYGSGIYGSGMYGSGMYGRPMLGSYGQQACDPSNPGPPSAWHAMLGGIGGIMHFFGRLSFLVDENAHAVHFFISALLQLLDRFGSLYGELARFILRLIGVKQEKKHDATQNAFDATWWGTVEPKQPRS